MVLTGMFVIAVATAAAVPAEDAGTATASPYRPSIQQPAVFRLDAKASDRPGSRPSGEPVIPSQFADTAYALLVHRATR